MVNRVVRILAIVQVLNYFFRLRVKLYFNPLFSINKHYRDIYNIAVRRYKDIFQCVLLCVNYFKTYFTILYDYNYAILYCCIILSSYSY